MVSSNLFAQIDSVEKKLSFDFGITRGRNINAWPIIKKYDDAEKSELQIMYPLFSKTNNYNLYSKHLHVLPFVINDSSAKGIDKRFVSLYYPSLMHIQKRNDSSTSIHSFSFLEIAPNISSLKISRSNNGLFVENNMFFFISYKKDPVSTRFIVFPAYWYFSNKYDTTHLVFPLYYKKTSETDKKMCIAFTYYYKRSLYEKKNTVFPIWWNSEYYNKGNTIKKNTLFPIYWSVKSETENNKILFPLLYSFKDSISHSFTAFPLFSSGQSTDSSRSHLVVTPFYWHLKQNNINKDILFPIYWNSTEYLNDDTIKKTTLFPFYWSVKSKNKNNKVIFPFVYSFKDSISHSCTVFPLFSSGGLTDTSRSHLVISPLYWHLKQGGGNKDILFPIFWSSKEYRDRDTIKKTTLFPLYWSTKSNERNYKILFPLVYSLKDSSYHSFTALPLFSYGKSIDSSRSYLTITPIYWHLEQSDRKKDILFPFFWNSKEYLDKDTIKKTTLFPIYWSIKSKDRNYKILFPLVFNIKDSSYHSFTILPFFSVGHSKDSTAKHLQLFQIYWHLQTNESLNKIVFPLWWKNEKYDTKDTTITRLLFPIYASFHGKTNNVDVLLPLYFKLKNQHERSVTLLPIFSYGQSTDSSRSHLAITPFYWHLNQKYSKRDILFPILWKSTNYPDKDTVKTTALFPIYWLKESKDKNYTVLFPLVYNIKDTSKQSFTFLPFYSKGRSNDSSKSYLALTPFYYHLNRPQYKKDILFPIYWNTSHYMNNDTLKETVLIPIYWAVKSKLENNKVLFPLVYSFKNSTYHSLSILPLFSKGQSADSSRSHLAITPLYWHFGRTDHKKDIIFPIFQRTISYLKNDTIKKIRLYPIYWSKKSKDENNKVLFPFIFSLKDSSYHSFTLFPLFSFGHNLRENNKYVMITPLAGFFHTPYKTSLFFFPVFNYKKQQNEVKSSVLLFVFRKTKKLNYSKTSVLWPICEHIRSESNTSFRIAPLVWYKKTDTSKMFSIPPLFYSNKNASKKTFIISFLLFKHENKIGYSVSNSVLWKVYHSKKYTNGDFEKRFLYLGYANIHLNDKIEKSVFPFYHYSKNSTGDVSRSVGLGFYNYFKRYIPEIKEYYEEERIFWLIRIRSNSEQLKSEGKGKYLKRK